MQSANFSLIQEEAKALYKSLLEFLPDIGMFQNEVLKAKPLPGCLEDKQSILKQLLTLLQTLRSQISQMKLDVSSMREDLKKTTDCAYNGSDASMLSAAVLKVESAGDEHEDSLENRDGPLSAFDAKQENMVQSHSVNDAVFKSATPINLPPSSSLIRVKKTRKSKCHICGERINSRFHHMQKYHPGAKNFPCKTCDMAFDNFKEFNNHTQTHVAAPNFHCDLCNRSLSTRPGIIKHILSHQIEKPYTCDVCGKSFRNKQSLTTCTHTHVSLSSSDIKYRPGFQCKICGDRVITADFLNRPVDKKSCPLDKPTIISKSGKEKTFCLHTDTQQIYFCIFCPKAYTAVRKLGYHMNFHFGIRSHTCDVCDEKFYTREAKKRHMYDKHSGEFPGRKCKICGEIRRSPLGLETHYLTHTPEERSLYNIDVKMTDCDICGKTVRRSALSDHKLTHSSKSSFICEVCGKGFKRKISLTNHVYVHMKPEDRPVQKPRQKRPHVQKQEKLFECDICFKRFAKREYLRSHNVTHTKVKDFKCNECGMSFTLPGNLNRHYALHRGQKRFQCDFCEKKFSQKVSRDIHRRIHTGEKPCLCHHCGKSFSDPSTLKKHKAKHDKDLSSWTTPPWAKMGETF